jgi:hypothetical protein
MSGQEGRELKDLGSPYEKVLEQILHTDAAGLEKMQKKHLITNTVVMQMIEKLTGEGGMFFEGTKKFAETFTGLETSIHDLFLQGAQDLGDVINDMVKPLAKEVIDSGF